MAIAKTNKLDMRIPEDTPCSCHRHLLFRSPACELWLGFEADVDADGIALANELPIVFKIRQVGSRVPFDELRLDFIEPAVPLLLLLPRVFDFLIGQGAVFKQLADALSQSSNVPVA